MRLALNLTINGKSTSFMMIAQKFLIVVKFLVSLIFINQSLSNYVSFTIESSCSIGVQPVQGYSYLLACGKEEIWRSNINFIKFLFFYKISVS